MTETGKAKTLASSLGQSSDRIPSDPDERVCLTLSRALRTEDTEKSTVSHTGASHTRTLLPGGECTTGVKTEEK